MEKRIPVLSLVVPLFLAWLLQGCVHVKGDVALIKATCNKTSVPSFCVSLFLANSSSLSADLFGLATISTGALISNVTAEQPVVAELARKATKSLLKNALTDCSASYSEGIRWGVEAVSHLAAKEFPDANISVGAIDNAVGGCHDVFDQFKLTFPPILDGFEKNIANLADVALTIINLLGGRPS